MTRAARGGLVVSRERATGTRRSVDAVDDEVAGRSGCVADLERTGDGVTRRVELGRIVGMQFEDHLAPTNLVAGSDAPDDAGAGGDRVLLA